MNTKNKWLVRGLFLIWMAGLYLYLKTPPFNFLVLNTFLAYIPIELSFHIDVGKPKNGLLFWVIIIIWLLFYPNTPYLLTDLFHLSLLNPYGINGLLRLDDVMWFKFALLLISTLFSTLLGLWGLDTVANAITARIHAKHIFDQAHRRRWPDNLDVNWNLYWPLFTNSHRLPIPNAGVVYSAVNEYVESSGSCVHCAVNNRPVSILLHT